MINKKIHINHTDKPDNIVLKINEIIEECEKIEKTLPKFMRDFFIYLKTSVSSSTRLEYLKDITIFCDYIRDNTECSNAKDNKDITIKDFEKIRAQHVNYFVDEHATKKVITKKDDKEIVTVTQGSRNTLSRRKSSISTLFKFLYRNEQLETNITDGFNTIKVPKKHPDAIKKLSLDETDELLSIMDTGKGLVGKEKAFWEKTKLRDKAIMMLFLTYGLRISELRELNISSFNFSRGEFKIYRKRGKETLMPINKSCEIVIKDYINNERTQSSDLEKEYKDALFLSLRNVRMTEKAIRNLVKKYTSIVLCTSRDKGYSPHKLRATTASNLIEKNFSIYDVQNLLDHDNVTTTQLYAAHKINSKRDILNNFELIEKNDK